MKELRVNNEDLILKGVDSGGSPILYYKDNPFTGVALTYEDGGWLSLEEEFQNGYLEGWIKSYFENGQLEEEYYLHNNEVKEGTYNQYDEQGNKLNIY